MAGWNLNAEIKNCKASVFPTTSGTEWDTLGSSRGRKTR